MWKRSLDDHARPRTDGPRMHSSARLALLTVLAIASMLGGTGSAQAADEFNPFPDSGVRTYTGVFSDCTVTVGPVRDPGGGTQQGAFYVIGGVHVQCQRRHHILVHVAEYHQPTGGAWDNIGQTQSAQFRNMLTFGSRIVQSLRICGEGGKLSGQWFTRAWVYELDSAGYVKPGEWYMLDSYSSRATARAC